MFGETFDSRIKICEQSPSLGFAFHTQITNPFPETHTAIQPKQTQWMKWKRCGGHTQTVNGHTSASNAGRSRFAWRCRRRTGWPAVQHAGHGCGCGEGAARPRRARSDFARAWTCNTYESRISLTKHSETTADWWWLLSKIRRCDVWFCVGKACVRLCRMRWFDVHRGKGKICDYCDTKNGKINHQHLLQPPRNNVFGEM